MAVCIAWAAPRFAIGKPGDSANEKINVAVIGPGILEGESEAEHGVAIGRILLKWEGLFEV